VPRALGRFWNRAAGSRAVDSASSQTQRIFHRIATLTNQPTYGRRDIRLLLVLLRRKSSRSCLISATFLCLCERTAPASLQHICRKRPTAAFFGDGSLGNGTASTRYLELGRPSWARLDTRILCASRTDNGFAAHWRMHQSLL
jgi:hypothetical protein